MKNAKTIHQTVVIKATPKAVYEALADGKKHAKFTGEKATNVKKVGGRFTCYDNYITGVNIELSPGKQLVQAWRSQDWPKGYYSLVVFAVTKAGKGKTKLTFTQFGVPANDVKAKSSGWKSHYWEPLKAMLES